MTFNIFTCTPLLVSVPFLILALVVAVMLSVVIADPGVLYSERAKKRHSVVRVMTWLVLLVTLLFFIIAVMERMINPLC